MGWQNKINDVDCCCRLNNGVYNLLNLVLIASKHLPFFFLFIYTRFGVLYLSRFCYEQEQL